MFIIFEIMSILLPANGSLGVGIIVLYIGTLEINSMLSTRTAAV